MKKDLWDSNSATFQGIFSIQDVDLSTKPVVVEWVMSLHIYGKFCYVDRTSSLSIRRENNRYNLI